MSTLEYGAVWQFTTQGQPGALYRERHVVTYDLASGRPPAIVFRRGAETVRVRAGGDPVAITFVDDNPFRAADKFRMLVQVLGDGDLLVADAGRLDGPPLTSSVDAKRSGWQMRGRTTYSVHSAGGRDFSFAILSIGENSPPIELQYMRGHWSISMPSLPIPVTYAIDTTPAAFTIAADGVLVPAADPNRADVSVVRRGGELWISTRAPAILEPEGVEISDVRGSLDRLEGLWVADHHDLCRTLVE